MHIAAHLFRAFVIVFFVGLIAGGIYAGFTMTEVSAGGVRYMPSSDVRIWLDPETGCEYITAGGGLFSPRLKADGSLMCDAEGKTE